MACTALRSTRAVQKRPALHLPPLLTLPPLPPPPPRGAAPPACCITTGCTPWRLPPPALVALQGTCVSLYRLTKQQHLLHVCGVNRARAVAYTLPPPVPLHLLHMSGE